LCSQAGSPILSIGGFDSWQTYRSSNTARDRRHHSKATHGTGESIRQAQKEAVAASLRELGWIAPVIENKRTGHLIDGHERVAGKHFQNGDEDVPYVLVDLSEQKEHLALTIFDPIGAMADTDREVLSALMDDVKTSEAALQGLIEDMADAENLLIPDDEFTEYDESIADDVKKATCPECGHVFPV
jgi:hypothetical protein